ncbi:MAG: hypothetical protein RLZ98_31 [Pseudomonadota bacterium]|jgi:pimeloyl-ACP methyl ester carboxylesterase
MPIQSLPTGVDMHYNVYGEGEPLVMVPSTALAGSIWEPYQVPELSRHMKVITFDPRGTGRTTAPDGVWTIEQLAADVAALLDHLGIEKAHLIGHSMGGRVALAFALAYPRRAKSLIMAASGSGIAARPGEECVAGVSLRMIDNLVTLGFEEYIRREFLERTTYFTSEFHNSHPDRVREIYDLAWKHHAKWKPFLRIVWARQNWEATHRLHEVKAPVLVVVGGEDEGGSNHYRQAEILLERLPDGEQLILPGQSHGFFWQAPDETNRWIAEWVRRHA